MNLRQGAHPSRKVKTGNDLGKKLAGYSAMAGAALAVGAGWADAAPQYTAGGQTIGPNQSFQIDLDGGGNVDFTLSLNFSTFFGSRSGRPVGYTHRSARIQGASALVSAGSAVKNFAWNSTILSGAGTANGSLANTYKSIYSVYFPGQGWELIQKAGPKEGNFLSPTKRGFIGVRFQDDALSLEHTGWIDVELTNLAQMTIHGWAWETDSGTAILAGDQGASPVPLPGSGSLAALALGAAGVLRWRNGRKNSEKDGRAN